MYIYENAKKNKLYLTFMHMYLIICYVQLLCKSWQRIIIEEKNKKNEIKIHKSTNHAYIYGWEGIILLYNREYYKASLYPYPNEPSRSIRYLLFFLIFLCIYTFYLFFILNYWKYFLHTSINVKYNFYFYFLYFHIYTRYLY